MMSGVDDLPDFASDNVAGIAPEILAALERANRGTAAAYAQTS